MPDVAHRRSFVVEIDGKAVLAFSATSLAEAERLCHGDWLSVELMRYTSCRAPLWREGSALKVRAANQQEAAEVEVARTREIADNEYEGVVFAFLVPLDPDRN